MSTGPVFLRDPERGGLLAFGSADAAARHLRPWQEVGAVAAWDADGRRLAFAVARRRQRLLGVWPRWREVVVARGVEAAPDGPAELRAALLAALGVDGGEALERLPLGELAARAARRCWADPAASP